MATYAAVLSLFHVIENIKTYRVRDPTFLDEQKLQLESLHKIVVSLQDFLETYSPKQAADVSDLESRIIDATYAAEDIIETYIVDYLHDIYNSTDVAESMTKSETYSQSSSDDSLESQIADVAEIVSESDIADYVDHASKANSSEGSTDTELRGTRDRKLISDQFSEELEKILESMGFLLGEVTEIKACPQFQVQPLRHLMPASTKPVPTNRNKASMKLFHAEMNQIIHKLTRGQPSHLTCSIVGMGGTGKTTLAKLIYENPHIVHHFDIFGWITVSETFKLRDLLVCLLRDIKVVGHDKGLEDHELREKLHKHLFGRRYLIVMDDIWDVEVLEKLKLFLPDNQNGSRILVTTRMSDVASRSGYIHKMNFLDERRSWELFSAMSFGKKGCPIELKEIAETVARNCKGLLLALSVLGGLLANSNITKEFLEHVTRDTVTIVNSNDEDHCFEILSTSYNNLPVYLKPCFLYLGVYEEDHIINAKELMRLWVLEGLIKPSKNMSMEENADNNLKDLIGRNLILVSKFGYDGNEIFCKMHDLVRDLCLREARKNRFLYVTKFDKASKYWEKYDSFYNIVRAVHLGYVFSKRFLYATKSRGFESHRRVAIHNSDPKMQRSIQLDSNSQSVLYPRSLTHQFGSTVINSPFDDKLLRVLSTRNCVYFEDGNFRGFNLRYISTGDYPFPRSIHLFWNLQSIHSVFTRTVAIAPSALWEIPHLRYVFVLCGFHISNPLVEKIEGKDDIVLDNLQTLGLIVNFICTEEVLRKFPNVTRLDIAFEDPEMLSTNCLENLGRVQKLEILYCTFRVDHDLTKPSKLVQTLEFPLSLKHLYLNDLFLGWEHMGAKIGSLPHLEKLELRRCNWGEEWETVEGQFLQLKYLKLHDSDLVHWNTESAHFPCLEHLRLKKLRKLEEIPSEIGEIQTLQSIKLSRCSHPVCDSAKEILEEQRSLCNDELLVTINGAQVHLAYECYL